MCIIHTNLLELKTQDFEKRKKNMCYARERSSNEFMREKTTNKSHKRYVAKASFLLFLFYLFLNWKWNPGAQQIGLSQQRKSTQYIDIHYVNVRLAHLFLVICLDLFTLNLPRGEILNFCNGSDTLPVQLKVIKLILSHHLVRILSCDCDSLRKTYTHMFLYGLNNTPIFKMIETVIFG